MTQQKSLIVNLILIGIVILLVLIPLSLLKDAEFLGSDDQAEKAIFEIVPNYVPWFEPLWEPPSGEIESLLFSIQAAIGSGVIFYCLGYLNGMRTGTRKVTR